MQCNAELTDVTLGSVNATHDRPNDIPNAFFASKGGGIELCSSPQAKYTARKVTRVIESVIASVMDETTYAAND